MTPLYGHASPETAYLVPDYPYGRTIRCRSRYWLESHPKHGFRFVSQTENPKTLRWNASKCSTYCLFAGAMFLDDMGHVQWSGVSGYNSVSEVTEFIEKFPRADLSRIAVFAAKKAKYLDAMARGILSMTMNGTVVTSAADREECRLEAPQWQIIVDACAIASQK